MFDIEERPFGVSVSTSTWKSLLFVETSDTLPEPSEGNTFNTIATGHGYCFIGEDQGVRSCVHTDDVGSCPTGLGYQSQATCQNPNLRD